MPENEKRICAKCKELHYCDDHHILPKKLFGPGETIQLCKNCHDQYHRFIGKKYEYKKNKQPMEFYFDKWYTWFYLSMAVGIILFIFSR